MASQHIDIDPVITICAECSEEQKEFGRLFHKYELIRLQLDKCIQSLHDRMKDGSKNLQLVQEYQKRMCATDPTKLFEAYVAECLRKEVLQNCALKIDRNISNVTAHPTVAGEAEGEEHLYSTPPELAPQPHTTQLSEGETKNSGFPSTSSPSRLEISTTYTMSQNNCYSNISNVSEQRGSVQVEEEICVKVEASALSLSENHFLAEAETDSTAILSDLSMPSPPASLIPFHSNFEQGRSESINVNISKSSSAQYACSTCGKSFASSNGLRGHTAVHTRSKILSAKRTGIVSRRLKKCDICGKMSSDLQRHMKTHLQAKSVSCNYCEKRFMSHHNYRLHFVAVHTMEAFSARLPPRTTEKEFENVVKSIFNRAKPVMGPDGQLGPNVECPYCSRTSEKKQALRTHLLLSHFDRVLMHFQTVPYTSMSSSTQEYSVSIEALDGDEGEQIIDSRRIAYGAKPEQVEQDPLG
ncbi:unnamed protein product [Orchesella dallaii]|uniref:C2H2-type domain-containing protein n=1 Tax=Orchesella dallaii TaxID=48710 RepID=A0ABP1RZD5_9HEXA